MRRTSECSCSCFCYFRLAQVSKQSEEIFQVKHALGAQTHVRAYMVVRVSVQSSLVIYCIICMIGALINGTYDKDPLLDAVDTCQFVYDFVLQTFSEFAGITFFNASTANIGEALYHARYLRPRPAKLEICFSICRFLRSKGIYHATTPLNNLIPPHLKTQQNIFRAQPHNNCELIFDTSIKKCP